jgi:hypothetical protein
MDDYNQTAETCIKVNNLMGAVSCYEWAKNLEGLKKVLDLSYQMRNITAQEAAKESISKLEQELKLS